MDIKSVRAYLQGAAKWLVLSVLVGVVVGPCGAAFGLALNWANATRTACPWLLWGLPAAGLIIVALYRFFGQEGGGSTNAVLVAVREKAPLPLRAAPLIFVSTVLTHLVGGSSGREGAALQLGCAIGGRLGQAFRLDDRDCHVITMCGMAAAFSAIFGTPLAATVFTLEVVSVGAMYYAALAPCLLSALTGVWIAGKMGVKPTAFQLAAPVEASPAAMVQTVLLAALLAGLSIVFCELMHAAPRLYARFLSNPYLRAAAGGGLVLALTLLLGTTDYNGAGEHVLHAAMEGEALPYAFLLKMLFTALTLGAGFKGGEIVPIFFTGATFGCAAAPLLGLPAPFGAALGMVALFCGATNCPLASVFLAAELFGGQSLPLLALGCAVAYMLSGYFSLYSEQRFVYDKLKALWINRQAE